MKVVALAGTQAEMKVVALAGTQAEMILAAEPPVKAEAAEAAEAEAANTLMMETTEKVVETEKVDRMMRNMMMTREIHNNKNPVEQSIGFFVYRTFLRDIYIKMLVYA